MENIKFSSIGIAVVSLSVLLLTGCGKKIPECGETSVLTPLNAVITRGINSSVPIFENVANGLLPVLNLQNPEMPDFFELAGVIAKSENLKLDGYSSTKKDKDSGMNYCTAVESGDLTAEIKFNVSKKYVDGIDVKSILPIIADDFTKNGIPIFNAAAKGKTKLVDIKPDGNTLVFRFQSTLPSTIIYQTNLSDSGDKVLVNVTENK